MFSFLRDLFSAEKRTASPDLAEVERRLARLLATRPLPPELEVAPPRPDVWGTTGKLGRKEQHSRFKPLLLNGHATTGLVYDYKSWGDADERTVHASYAWLDRNGRLQAHQLREEYDPHVGWNANHNTGLVDIDAELDLDKVVTIVQDPSSGLHVIYEYLRVNPRWQEELGVCGLEWEPGAGAQRARASRSPGEEPLFTIEREEGPEGGWRVLRDGQLRLRSTGGGPLQQGESRRLLDARGQEAGQVTAKERRFQITHAQRTFFLTEEPNRLWLIRAQDGERVLGIFPDEESERLWHLVAHTRLERSLGELLVLSFLASDVTGTASPAE
jgi:hypothetical protein